MAMLPEGVPMGEMLAQSPAGPTATEKHPVTHPIEKLWRVVGLPESFLGNGGTNHKLYELYDRLVGKTEDRIDQLEHTIKSRCDDINRQCTSIRGAAREMHDAYCVRIEGVDKRLDIHDKQITKLDQSQMSREPTMTTRYATGGRIKGGWVNVFDGDYGRRRLGSTIFQTLEAAKANADANGEGRRRVACIPISDFTEGDGL